MASAIEILSWTLASGRRPQAFLDAWWVAAALGSVGGERRVAMARRLLALSPHYLLGHRPWRAGDAALAEAFAAMQASRQRIFDRVFLPDVGVGGTFLDYGCGPGCLSVAAARYAERVVGVDISSGVLACARVLSVAPNLTYVTAPTGLDALPDASVHAVGSLAVLQHLTTEAVDRSLRDWHRLLVPGGRVVAHVVLDSTPDWRREEDWRRDVSVTGRARYRLGLHCFARPASWYEARLAAHGFAVVDVLPIAVRTGDVFDDVCAQHLVVARRDHR